jgi:uncharacterized membrane protein YqgA involved in biofilm formation
MIVQAVFDAWAAVVLCCWFGGGSSFVAIVIVSFGCQYCL